jgi:hypothetical protein
MQYDQTHRPFLCRDPFAACDHVLYREKCRTVRALSCRESGPSHYVLMVSFCHYQTHPLHLIHNLIALDPSH